MIIIKKHILKLISLILIFVLMFSFAGCKKEQEIVLPENVVSEKTTTYDDYKKANFFYLSNLNIPHDWHLEERDDGFSVIERKTGTEIYFAISDYNPSINNVTLESAKSALTANGKEFISFQKPSGDKLIYKYVDKINGMDYTILETIVFNYKYQYTLKLYSQNKYFEKYESLYNDVVSSMMLTKDYKTIPVDYNGMYYEKYGMLFVYPRNWKTTSGSDYYTTSYANSSVSVTCSAKISNFAGLDKTTYTAIMQQTVANFSTSNFALSGYTLDAEGYYTENSVKYIVYNRIYNLANFSINIIYAAPENEAASYSSAYATIINNIFQQ